MVHLLGTLPEISAHRANPALRRRTRGRRGSAYVRKLDTGTSANGYGTGMDGTGARPRRIREDRVTPRPGSGSGPRTRSGSTGCGVRGACPSTAVDNCIRRVTLVRESQPSHSLRGVGAPPVRVSAHARTGRPLLPLRSLLRAPSSARPCRRPRSVALFDPVWTCCSSPSASASRSSVRNL